VTWSNVSSQRFFILERPGTVKNYKFQEGEHIHIEVKSEGITSQVRGELSHITDTSVIINWTMEFKTSEISAVYRERSLIRILQVSSLLAGSGYIVLDCFNRAINKETPLVDKSSVIISGSLIAGSVALIPFEEHKYKMGVHWRVKTIVYD
jgi:hypothetical protein